MPKLFRSVFVGAVLFTSASMADARKDAETLADAFLNVPAMADSLRAVFRTPGLNAIDEYLAEAGIDLENPWGLARYIEDTYVQEMSKPIRAAYAEGLLANLSASTLRAAAEFYTSEAGREFLAVGTDLDRLMEGAFIESYESYESYESLMETIDGSIGAFVAERLIQEGTAEFGATSEELLAFLRSHPPLNGGEYPEPVVQPEPEAPGLRKLTPLPKE
ncbi:MAG: hypothetical protein AAGA78_11490 [Pseudomonadota bacterium]